MSRKTSICAAAAVAVAVAAATFFFAASMRAKKAAIEEGRRIALAERLDSLGINASVAADGFYPLPPRVPCDMRSAELGAELFRDRRLNAPSGRSCASCHPANNGGTDGRMHGGVPTRPVANAAFSEFFMHDGSVTGLAAAVEYMVKGKSFGGCTNLDYTAAWIGSDRKFAFRYRKRYPEGVNASNAVEAVAEYIKTQVSGNKPFDRYVAGRKDALDDTQCRGYALFRERKCADCHAGPALGGWNISDGKKVPALRGLSLRQSYIAAGLRSDLGAVLPFMPGGDFELAEDRIALIAFLNTL